MENIKTDLSEYSYVRTSCKYWKRKIKNFGLEMMHIFKTVSWTNWKTLRQEFCCTFMVLFILSVFFYLIYLFINMFI